MIHLSSDLIELRDKYGLDPTKSMLFSAIRLDSQPFVAPIIAKSDTDEVLLVRQQEQGNVLSAGVPREKIRFYEPWMTLDARITANSPASSSLLELVKEIAASDSVALNGEIPYTHYRTLSSELNVTVDKAVDVPTVAYEVDTEAVLQQFLTWRREGLEDSRKLVQNVPHLDGLVEELTLDEDTRYSELRSIAGAENVDAVLLGAPPNFSEVTGLAQSEDTYALWLQAEKRVVVIAPASTTNIPLRPLGRFASLGHAVQSISPGASLAVEEQWLPSSVAAGLESAGFFLVPFSRRLGHWRDVRDHEVLPFQIIAARASVYAIEEALSWAKEGLDAGKVFSELDLYDVYLDNLVQFRVDNEIEFAIEPYFTNLHSSNRMLFPGPPVDYPLDEETTCIQLDAGVRVTVEGITVATSDMARSLPRVPEAVEAYSFFFDVVREGIIGQLKPGVVCEDVHEGTLQYLAPHLQRMIEIGMLGDEVDFNAEYRKRNVGHLMGKQESFANELRPGYKHVLQAGSYGAAEIPWRYGRAAIGTEDLWYIGHEKTYILTRR